MKRIPWDRNSILLRLTLFMTVLLFGHSVLLIGALAAGGLLSRTREDAFASLTQKVITPRNYLQSEMTSRWSSLYPYADQFAEMLPPLAAAAQGDAEREERFLTGAMPLLVGMLRATTASGAFIILDNAGAPDHSSLYLRDYDPTLNDDDNLDLYLVAGPSAVSTDWRIPLDKIWKSRMPRAQTDQPFYNKPMTQAQQGVDPALLGYWSPPFRLTPPDIPIITFTTPLPDADGVIRGVMGVEISLYYLQRALPAVGYRAPSDPSFLLGFRPSRDEAVRPILASNAALNHFVQSGAPLPDDSSDTPSLLTDAVTGEPYYASAQSLELYAPNTPFAEEEWSLIGLVPRDNLLEFTLALQRILLWSFLASLALGMACGFAGSYHVTRPIVDLARRVRANRPGSAASLGKTGLREIDELAGAIKEANRRLLDSTVKMSAIIEMVDVPIGAFEYREDDPRVFATDGLWRILSLNEQEAEELYRDKDLFVRRLGILMSRPEPEEEHVYKIQDAPVKWVRINMASAGGATLGVVMDVSAEIHEKKKIRFDRDFDSLTRLYNREAFRRRVIAALENGLSGVCALAMLDLDYLKPLNDNFGHAWGDIYIRTTAALLNEFCPGHCIAGRRSGDEFMLFLHGFTSRADVREAMDSFYLKLNRHSLSLPDGTRRAIAISAGIAWIESADVAYDELLQCADFTLYKAKKTAKGGYCISDEDDGERARPMEADA